MANKLTFKTIPPSISFPKMEEEVLSYWEKINAFRRSQELSKGRKSFSFYDGPPFATGLPHYGHILAGTIKDIVPRYAHQTGHYVERRFGWDTHGLPVEFEIDKKLGIKSRADVLKMGIAKYNSACREIVMRYSNEWRKTVTRCGRWVDFDNDYKTLHLSYMESVWWVFKTIFDKGMIYRGYKIMPFSTRLGTPLSNFEANLNYKDVNDKSIIVNFPLRSDPSTKLIAWTTTPWTLPSNLSLCVKASTDYVRIEDLSTGEKYILAESRVCELYKNAVAGKDYNVLERFKGKALENKEYLPIFDFFSDYKEKGAFKVLCDDYVTEKSGTGVVQQAPGFGEDDYRVCLRYGIVKKGENVLCPVDSNGHFTDEVSAFKRLYVKDADRLVIRALRASGRLVRESQVRHSYPFCWRSDTPLIYKAVPSWFLDVESIKTRLQANTAKTRWVPAYVRDKRFSNWLEDARDWAISRSRFWGTPLPVWTNEDFSEFVVPGSVAELEELSGRRGVSDLHRESIDDITIPSPSGKGVLRRIDEVFDCWFESGSMPYAQKHYPFENKQEFEDSFPADFIGEGLDQTRGWFYTLMVLSTALFDQPAFKNLICTGLVLAEDGKKMSKRLSNYPSPQAVIDKFGADALRVYLINSPVVRGESLRFSEKGVFAVVKSVMLLWHNTYRFFVENATRFEQESGERFRGGGDVFAKAEKKLDLWICSSFQTLVEAVKSKMAEYQLNEVTPELLKFLSQLSLWYVRISRERMKGLNGREDARVSLQILHWVLFNLCRLMAPFTPFVTEKMYQNLKLCLEEDSPLRVDSVHFLMIPEANPNCKHPRVELAMQRTQAVIELGRCVRDSRKLPFKQPLSAMTVVNADPLYLEDVKEFKEYIEKDLNVHSIEFCSEMQKFASLVCVPKRRDLGRRLKKKAIAVMKAIENLPPSEVRALQKGGTIEVNGEEVYPQDVKIELVANDTSGRFAVAGGEGCCVALDTKIDDALLEECRAREFLSFVQKLKKQLSLDPSTKIEIFFWAEGHLLKSIQGAIERVREKLGKPCSFLASFEDPLLAGRVRLGKGDSVLHGDRLKVLICRSAIVFRPNDSASECDEAKAERISIAKKFLLSKNLASFEKELRDKESGEKVEVFVEGEKISFERGKDFFFSLQEMEKA